MRNRSIIQNSAVRVEHDATLKFVPRTPVQGFLVTNFGLVVVAVVVVVVAVVGGGDRQAVGRRRRPVR